MQDDPKARVKNRVPIEKREILSEDDAWDKGFGNIPTDYSPLKKKMNSGWSTGQGSPNFKREYFISDTGRF